MNNYYFTSMRMGETFLDITFKDPEKLVPIRIFSYPDLEGEPAVELNKDGFFSGGQKACGWENINCTDPGFKVNKTEKGYNIRFKYDRKTFMELLRQNRVSPKTIYPFILGEHIAFYDQAPLEKSVKQERAKLKALGECE